MKFIHPDIHIDLLVTDFDM